MFSCSQFAGGPARNPGLVALILLLGTLHVTKQFGVVVGVGACRTVAAGSVSVPGAVDRVLWTGVCMSVDRFGFWSSLVREWVDPWDWPWDRATALWSETGGDLGPWCAGRPSSVVRTDGGAGGVVVQKKHNVFAVVVGFHLFTRRGAVGGPPVGGWVGHVWPMGGRCCCWWVGIGLRSMRGS